MNQDTLPVEWLEMIKERYHGAPIECDFSTNYYRIYVRDEMVAKAITLQEAFDQAMAE